MRKSKTMQALRNGKKPANRGERRLFRINNRWRSLTKNE